MVYQLIYHSLDSSVRSMPDRLLSILRLTGSILTLQDYYAGRQTQVSPLLGENRGGWGTVQDYWTGRQTCISAELYNVCALFLSQYILLRKTDATPVDVSACLSVWPAAALCCDLQGGRHSTIGSTL